MLARRISMIAAVALSVAAVPALAQSTHDVPGMDHASMTATGLPVEPGQGAFAAISEILTILRADPETDWSRVDIAALRMHLVDMDRLVTDTVVASRNVAGGLEMTISTAGPGADAAGRMVPAHGPVLAEETGWNSELTEKDNALIWTVTSGDDEMQIRAIGFYGLMATGDHHRMHHLAIASGNPPH